jgi:hypothetical protein
MTVDLPGVAWWLDRAFIYIGRMDPSKGVRFTIEAYAALAKALDAPPPLWLVGGLPREIERLRLEALSVVAPLEERRLITWWGFQRSAAISGLFSRSLALVMHSQYEPGGRVVLEALGAGLPVIATPYGFAREFVRDWVSGFLVDYGDVELLRVRMEHFARQPLLRNAMGPTGRALVADALNAWRFVDAHCEAYDDATSQATGDVRIETTPPTARCDALHTRTFAPTYPFSRAIDDGIVEDVVRVFRPDLRVFHRRAAPSHEWYVTDGKETWILTQVQPRFEVRPLWDRRAGIDPVRTAEDRFTAARVASSHPPFVPVTIVSEPHRLIMRPVGQPVTRPGADFTSLAQVLRMLGTNDVPELSMALADAHSRLQIEDAADVLLGLRHLASEVRPAFRSSIFSPALGWHVRLRQDHLSTTRLWTPRDINDATAFADLATRIAPHVVLTHGYADLTAFMTHRGALCLISGADVECAVMGKDLACLLLNAVSESDLGAATLILDGCDREEGDAVLAWAGILAFEGVCRNAALRRPLRLGVYRHLWSVVSTLLRHVNR